MMRTVGLVMVACAIVGISPFHARAEADRCLPVPAAMERFEATSELVQVPDVAFVEDGATDRTLGDFRGRGVVLNFWATWCAPCVHEMPALDHLRAELADEGVDVLALSSDFGGAKVVERFYAKNDIANLPVLNDTRGRLAQAFGLKGLPTTILIDAEGREVGRVVGPAEWAEEEVAQFLSDCLAPAG